MAQYDQFHVSTLGESSDRAALLSRRFINYLISLNFARGQYMAEEGLAESDDEQSRELLAVEQKRRAERARKDAVQEKVRAEVQQQLHKRLYKEVERRLQDQSYIRDRVLMLPENAPALLDALFAPATTSRKIETLSQGLDWMQVGMVKIVNRPPFADPHDSMRAKITNYRGAINFVGAEDIKIIAPALTMQSWLPPAEPPFVLLRRKLWQHVMGTGVVTQHLVEQNEPNLDPAVAFCVGIFHEMGKVVLARLYLKIFDDVRSKMLQELRNETTSARYNALVRITPDQQFLRDLMLQKERQVTELLFSGFEFKRLPLAQVYHAYADVTQPGELSGYAKALYQANTYSEFRMLHAANLATLDDGKRMFAAADLSANTVKSLRHVHLKKLLLSRNRDSA